MQGYGHAAYAASLSEFGQPRHLQRSNGWLLERAIRGFGSRDAMGCYPLFVCSDWSGLGADLEEIGKDLISLSLVTDPFGEYDEAYLDKCFPDMMRPFKRHFVVDLGRRPETFVHSHHQRNTRRAHNEVKVERCANPIDALDRWVALYDELIERHKIVGVAAFSRAAFVKQLAVPGIVAFQAVEREKTVGMVLWYEQRDRAYYHLGAYSARGYQVNASFALIDYSIRYFGEREREWLSLGGGTGLDSVAESGLMRFKRGWSTGVRTAYFCGRIFDHRKYEELVNNRGVLRTEYFPAYREDRLDGDRL